MASSSSSSSSRSDRKRGKVGGVSYDVPSSATVHAGFIPQRPRGSPLTGGGGLSPVTVSEVRAATQARQAQAKPEQQAKIIKTTRQRLEDIKTTERQKRITNLLRRQGYKASMGGDRQVIAKKDGKKITITKQGKVIRSGESTTTPSSTITKELRQVKSQLQKETPEEARLRRDIKTLRKYETQVTERAERVPDAFRSVLQKATLGNEINIPLKVFGLQGRINPTETIANVLSLPFQMSIGGIESAIIAGTKARITGQAKEAVRTGKINTSMADIKAEEANALQKVPGVIAEQFNPLEPAGLANVIGLVVTAKIAKQVKGKSAATTKTTSVPKVNNLVAKKLIALSRRFKSAARKTKNPILKKQLLRRANKIRAQTKSPSFIKKVTNKVRQSIRKTKGKSVTKENMARVKIREVEINKQAIKNLQKQKRALTKNIGKGKLAKGVAKQNKRAINNQIRKIKTKIKSANKVIRKQRVSPAKRAKFRREIKKGLKPKQIKQQMRSSLGIRVSAKPGARRLVRGTISKVGDLSKRYIKQPTKTVISSVNKGVRNFGYKVVRLSSKVTKPLTRAAKSSIGKIMNQVNRVGRFTKNRLTKLNRVLRRAGYKIQEIAFKAKTRAIIETRAVKSFVRNKIKNMSKLARKGIRKVTFKKNLVKVYLKGKGATLSRTVTETLNAINQKLPVNIKLKVVIKGKVRSWPQASRIIKQQPIRGKIGIGARITRPNKILAKRIILGKQKITAKTPAPVRKLVRNFRRGKGKFFKELKSVGEKLNNNQLDRLIKQIERGTSSLSEFERILTKRNYRRLAARYKKIKMTAAGKKQLAQLIKERNKTREAFRRTSAQSDEMIAALRRQKPVKDINKAQSKINQISNTIETESGGQTLIQKKPVTKQKVQKIKNKIKEVSNTQSKTKAKQAYKEAAKTIQSSRNQALKLVQKAKTSTPNLLSKVYKLSAVSLGALGALANSLNRAAAKSKSNIKAKVTVLPKQTIKQKQATETIQETEQAAKQGQSSAVQVLNALAPAAQILYIQKVLNAFGGQNYLRGLPKGGRINVDQMLPRYRRAYFSFVKNKMFSYTPSLYARYFKVRAKGKERRRLLSRGRLFSGQEIRKIV